MFRKVGTDSLLEWPTDNGTKITLVCGRVLGKGGFGKCYEVFSRENGRRLACKVIDKQSPQYALTREKVQSEVGLHRRMSHPNIVRFESYHEDERFIYILLELCSNNTLDDVLNRRKHLTEIEVRYYLRQILEGVRYMHDQRIVHRDLKLQNFFISDQMTVKIGDFGLASLLPPRTRRKSICGTPNYMAPEIFTNRDGYSFEVDVWSLGVIAFLLLCGRMPFEDRSPEGIAAQLKKGLNFSSRVSEQAQSLVGKMLHVGPGDRSSLRHLLKHDFFTLFEIPQTIPLSCLVCEPTQSFTGKYAAKRKPEPQEDGTEEFQFLLESKDSPNSERGGNSLQMNYKQIQSEMAEAEGEIQTLPAEQEGVEQPPRRVCSFGLGYESKQNDSCHIKKWIIEYKEHPRYGLLYKTSDGLVGVRFNDGSNLKLADHTKHSFTYLPNDGRNTPTPISLPTLSTAPKEVKIKVAVLLKLLSDTILQQSSENGSPLFVRLYLNTLSVFLLWLSNGALQGRFRDGSELLLSADACMHIDQRGKTVFPSRLIKEQSQQVQEKLAVIEEVVARAGRTVRELRTEGTFPPHQNHAQMVQIY